MMTIDRELALCTDCTMGAVNDDYTGLDYYLNEPEATERMEQIQAGLAELGPNLCPGDGDSDEFSVSPCDCCGTSLAGRRHPFVTLAPA